MFKKGVRGRKRACEGESNTFSRSTHAFYTLESRYKFIINYKETKNITQSRFQCDKILWSSIMLNSKIGE